MHVCSIIPCLGMAPYLFVVSLYQHSMLQEKLINSDELRQRVTKWCTHACVCQSICFINKGDGKATIPNKRRRRPEEGYF